MTLYEVLGVPSTATDDEIKTAYRKAVKKYHPDREGGDAARFRDVQLSYEVLSDASRRARYDQTGQYDDKESKLHQTLVGIFTDVVSRAGLLDDVIEATRDNILLQMRKFRDNITSNTQVITKLNRMAKRIQCSGKSNRLAESLLLRIENLKAANRENEDAIDGGKMMLAMLDEYSFDKEQDNTWKSLRWEVPTNA